MFPFFSLYIWKIRTQRHKWEGWTNVLESIESAMPINKLNFSEPERTSAWLGLWNKSTQLEPIWVEKINLWASLGSLPAYWTHLASQFGIFEQFRSWTELTTFPSRKQSQLSRTISTRDRFYRKEKLVVRVAQISPTVIHSILKSWIVTTF